MTIERNYTTTEGLVGRPYYLSYDDAVGKWDIPEHDGNARYVEADILGLLGLVP
jgi:hypothetical protein